MHFRQLQLPRTRRAGRVAGAAARLRSAGCLQGQDAAPDLELPRPAGVPTKRECAARSVRTPTPFPRLSCRPSLLSLLLASRSHPHPNLPGLRSPGFWSATSTSGCGLFLPAVPPAFFSLRTTTSVSILVQSSLSPLPSFLFGCLGLSFPSLLFILAALCVSSLYPLAGPSPTLFHCRSLSPAPIPPASGRTRSNHRLPVYHSLAPRPPPSAACPCSLARS